MVALVGNVLVLPQVCAFGAWEVLYQTDFSTDPFSTTGGWITNDSSRYRWDSAEGALYADQYNINYGGTYAHYDTNYGAGSFRLQYDFKMLQSDWASDVSFGVYDTDLNSNNHGSFAQTVFTTEDRGRTILSENLDLADTGGGGLRPQTTGTSTRGIVR